MNVQKLKILEPYPPATDNDIARAEEKIKCKIPLIYKEFLKQMNGADMNLCVLYGTDSIAEMYNCNEFAEYAPGYLSIGNDNGDKEIIMCADENADMCGFIDAGSIGSAEPDEWFGFKKWVENGCEIKEQKNLFDTGNVLLTKLPEDKLKGLVKIKKTFALNQSTSEFLKTSDNLPCVIAGEITSSKAKILIEKSGYRDCLKFVFEKGK